MKLKLEEDIQSIRNQMLKRAVNCGAKQFAKFIDRPNTDRLLFEDFMNGQFEQTRFLPSMVPQDVVQYPARAHYNNNIIVQRGVNANVNVGQPPQLYHPFKLLLVGDGQCGKTSAAENIVQTPFMDFAPAHITLIRKMRQDIYNRLIGNTPHTLCDHLREFDPVNTSESSLVIIDDCAIDAQRSEMYTWFF